MLRLFGTLAVVLFLPATVRSQLPITLPKPDAEFPEPFTQIASIREMRDGRALVLDRRDRIVLLVDLRRGNAQRVGRQGTGPGEYSQPGRLFALQGDTTAIYDGPARRFLKVEPDGTTGDAFRLDLATGAGQRRGGVPKFSDARGRIFTEGSAFARELRAADSTAITRFERGAAKGDTIAYVRLDKQTIEIREVPGGGVSISNGVRAFAWRDDWVALAEGGVAVARVNDYHIDWFSPTGERTSSPVVRHDRVPVTNADKDNARDERLAAIRSAMPRSGGTTGAPIAPVGLPELTFPADKPPFEAGNVFARPNGEVWVLRSSRANERVAVYDVFTKTGGLVTRVALPPRTRLAGFGTTAIYAIRLDDDDLQYLVRWNAPALRRTPGGLADGSRNAGLDRPTS